MSRPLSSGSNNTTYFLSYLPPGTSLPNLSQQRFPPLPPDARHAAPLHGIENQSSFTIVDESPMSAPPPPHGSDASSGAATSKPPRPPNAWIIYRSEKLKSMPPPAPGEAKRPQADVSKRISLMWRNEPEEVRNRYEHLAEVAKADHARTYPNYRFAPMKKADKERLREAKKAQREAERSEARKARQRTAPYYLPHPHDSSSRSGAYFRVTTAPLPHVIDPMVYSPPISCASSPEPSTPSTLSSSVSSPYRPRRELLADTPPTAEPSPRSVSDRVMVHHPPSMSSVSDHTSTISVSIVSTHHHCDDTPSVQDPNEPPASWTPDNHLPKGPTDVNFNDFSVDSMNSFDWNDPINALLGQVDSKNENNMFDLDGITPRFEIPPKDLELSLASYNGFDPAHSVDQANVYAANADDNTYLHTFNLDTFDCNAGFHMHPHPLSQHPMQTPCAGIGGNPNATTQTPTWFSDSQNAAQQHQPSAQLDMMQFFTFDQSETSSQSAPSDRSRLSSVATITEERFNAADASATASQDTSTSNVTPSVVGLTSSHVQSPEPGLLASAQPPSHITSGSIDGMQRHGPIADAVDSGPSHFEHWRFPPSI